MFFRNEEEIKTFSDEIKPNLSIIDLLKKTGYQKIFKQKGNDKGRNLGESEERRVEQEYG